MHEYVSLSSVGNDFTGKHLYVVSSGKMNFLAGLKCCEVKDDGARTQCEGLT